MSNLTKVKLGDILDVKRGMSLSGEYYSTNGSLIRLTLGNFTYPECGFKNNTSKSDIYFVGPVKEDFIMKKGDIITPLTEQVRGLLGNTATIPANDTYIQSGDIGKIIPNEKLLNKRFAYYLISSPTVKYQLDSASQQTKIRHTSPDKIKDCVAFLPNLDYQIKVSNLLDNLNNKIETNNKTIQSLESLAKTIYDYWFLQFEFPNEEGKPYKSSGGKMVWNEELKREIPEEWEVKRLADLCTFGNGINFDKDVIGDKNYKIVNVRDISASSLLINKQIMNTISLPSELANKYLVKKDDILIARSGTPGAVRLVLDIDNVIYCGFIIHCLPNDSEIKLYLTFTLKLYEGTKATKTGGSIFQNVSQDTLKSLTVQVPPKKILLAFNSKLNSLIDKMQICSEENNQLTSLRDWLLPMLMNGQVTFKENAHE